MDPLHPNSGFFIDTSASPFSPSSREDVPSSAASTHHGQHDLDDFHFDFDQAFPDLDSVSFVLQKPSHDDACLSTCVAGLGGFPHHQPPAAHRGAALPQSNHARQRHSVSSVPCTPYLGFGTDFYQPAPAHHFTHPLQPYGVTNPDLDFKLPVGFDSKGGYMSFQNLQQLGSACDPGADACHMGQRSVVDDCASVNCSMVSCSEQCCSVDACHDEECGDGLCQDDACDEGTPCDNVDCLDPSLPDHFDPMWHVHQDEWLQPEGNLEDNTTAHSQQPCNHTHTEHDVAVTLRDLKVPSSDMHPAVFPSFGCSILDGLEHPDGPHHHFSPTHLQPDLTYASTVDSSPSESKTDCAPHTCQWALGTTETDGQEHVCGKVFLTSEELNDHLCQDHVTLMSSKTKYLCLWKGCMRRDDQVFASRNKLRRHIATHTCYKPHQCLTCGERFSAKQALDQHERTHTGDKPYTCPYDGCSKSFKQKSALTMHIRTHTGEKPLKCEICGKSFCESSNLSKHRKTHNPDYKYKCDEPGCDSQFIRIDQLRRHQAKHVRQKKKSDVRSSQQQQKTSMTAAPTTLAIVGGDWGLVNL
ncbi:zinc finger protein 143/76 [Microdochium nivale]|nr:zinc finger protein 143/76 [Microdochium nivale]